MIFVLIRTNEMRGKNFTLEFSNLKYEDRFIIERFLNYLYNKL